MSDASKQEDETLQATTSNIKELLAKQQEEKKAIVIEAVHRFCTHDSPFEVLRTMAAALANNDDKLTAKVIAGGKTNFSYKVQLEADAAVAVFSKITFSYALWDPTRSPTYDVKRTENEFWLAGEFTKIMGKEDAPIPVPFHLVKLCENSRLVITEWAKTDEQWCNQFIDGQVDERLIPKVARALAKFNTTTIEGFVDPYFNDNAGRIAHLLLQANKDIFRDLVVTDAAAAENDTPPGGANDDNDKCLKAMMELGIENYTALMDAAIEAHNNQRDIICHNDSHCFNILVEKKPSLELTEKFGPIGNFVLCDWEMACVGARGADAGRIPFFSTACAMCHAVQGHKDEAYHLIDFGETFYDAYLQALVEYGGPKFEKELIATFRSSLGFTGIMLHPVLYQMRIFCDVAPLQGVSEQDAQLAIGAAGLIGLTDLQYGFGNLDPDLTLAELRGKQREMLMREVDALLAHAGRRAARPRRLSILRAIGRRVSDASLYDEDTVQLARRLSAEHAPSSRRSTLLGPLIGLNFLEEDASLMFSDSSHDGDHY